MEAVVIAKPRDFSATLANLKSHAPTQYHMEVSGMEARITLDRERNLWQLWLPNVAGPAYEHSDLIVLERLLDQLQNQ